MGLNTGIRLVIMGSNHYFQAAQLDQIINN